MHRRDRECAGTEKNVVTAEMSLVPRSLEASSTVIQNILSDLLISRKILFFPIFDNF